MVLVLKNVYIDKLVDIVNKYNNIYHSRIKMKPIDIKANTYIDSNKEINNKNQSLFVLLAFLTQIKKLIIKILNLKLEILLKYQNIKMYLQKVIFHIGQKKFV